MGGECCVVVLVVWWGVAVLWLPLVFGGCDSVQGVVCACCVSVCLLLVCVLCLVSVDF